MPQTVSDDRALLLRRGLRLEYVTLVWNALEFVWVAFAALRARSVALAGFSVDTLIEIYASVIVVGRLKGHADPLRERMAQRRIGFAFAALIVYLVVQSAIALIADVKPHHSRLGIALLAATAFVMFALGSAKSMTGNALQHAVLRVEAKVTLVDGALATAILIGLVLNAVAGWWWADLCGAAVIVAYAANEARHTLRSVP